ncbi:MAG TPA: di-heme-cytochrome C peroxidase, partial [Pyrinomonadaceae bacterium]|nr:di-heme-cytochrome C peroxidase [Pyrinomonadaceae bacterium]
LKENYNLQNATRLRFEVGEFVKGQLAGVEKQKEADRRLGLTPTKGGFGRIDALGAGGNRLYAKLGDQNLRTLNAPVKIMPLWNTHRYNWVQTNGSIRQPMARNIIEALAVSASVVFPGDPQQNDRFLSSVRTENMFKMETLISRFKTPVWPQSLLGTLDEGKVERGKEHYDLHCAACHAPRMENTPEPGDKVSVRHDKRYFVARLIPAEEVGTDVTDAKNFAERTLDASAIGLSKNEPGPNIIAMVLGGIIQRQYDDRKLSQDQQDEWSGYRDNLLRACVAYPARPLAGIWAAAPYLHNGSVPNLYQLLLPPEQRVKKFCMDSIEYDPVNVGYVYDNNPCSFVLDTSQTGNSNAGHNYGTSLTHEQRLELIEFLKVLPFPEGDYETTEPQATCPQPGTPGAVPTATPKSGWW